MEYDIHYGDFIFKHALDSEPEADLDIYAKHYHMFYEMFLFISGDADFVIEQNRYALNPYTLLLVKPGDHHNLILKSQEPYERIVLRFNELDVPKQVRDLLKYANEAYDIRGTQLSGIFGRLDEHYANIQGELIHELLRCTLVEILTYLLGSNELSSIPAVVTNEKIEHITSYIENNLGEIRTLDDLSGGLLMSKSTLYKFFYEQFNTPIMSYVRTKKCMLAHSLLIKGVPATDVYLQCGFSDYSSFYRAYTKVFHRSPSRATETIYIKV